MFDKCSLNAFLKDILKSWLHVHMRMFMVTQWRVFSEGGNLKVPLHNYRVAGDVGLWRPPCVGGKGRGLSGGCKRTGCPSSLWPSRLKRLRLAASSRRGACMDERCVRCIENVMNAWNALHYHEMHERFSWMVYEKGFIKDFHEWLCERFYERFLPIGSWSLGKCLLLNGRNAFKWKKKKMLAYWVYHSCFVFPTSDGYREDQVMEGKFIRNEIKFQRFVILCI